jgi:hypothetical protein
MSYADANATLVAESTLSIIVCAGDYSAYPDVIQTASFVVSALSTRPEYVGLINHINLSIDAGTYINSPSIQITTLADLSFSSSLEIVIDKTMISPIAILSLNALETKKINSGQVVISPSSNLNALPVEDDFSGTLINIINPIFISANCDMISMSKIANSSIIQHARITINANQLIIDPYVSGVDLFINRIVEDMQISVYAGELTR